MAVPYLNIDSVEMTFATEKGPFIALTDVNLRIER